MPAYNSQRNKQTLTLRRLRSLHLAHFADQVRRGMRSQATLTMHVRTWRYIVDHFGAGADARRITRHRLQLWISSETRGRLERADGSRRVLSPASIRLRVCTLRAALKVARREGLIRRLPEFPETHFRYESKTQWLETFEDYQRIFDQLPTERAEYFALLIWTWQHPSDVERMTRGDIHPFATPPWVYIRSTKNRRPPLRVQAPAELARIFRAKFRREGVGRLEDRLVSPWPSRVRTLPAVCERLGLPRITATAARHTGISWAIREIGITPAVMAWSGHRSPKMISTVYGHALKAQLTDVAAALDSMRAARAKKSEPPPTGGGSQGNEMAPSVLATPTGPEHQPGETDSPGGLEPDEVPRDRIELSTQEFSVNPPCGSSIVCPELKAGPPDSVSPKPGGTECPTASKATTKTKP